MTPIDPPAGGGAARDPRRRWHLAEDEYEEVLTAFEFSVLQVERGFQRFAVQALHVAGDLDLAFNEVVALHVVRMQERAKDSATIAQLTNRDDLPNLQYNLRKLVSLGLLERTKSGTASVFAVTPAGREITDRYAELRRQVLASNLAELTDVTAKLQLAIRYMHILTGLYEAASRELATINPAVMFTPAGNDEQPGAEGKADTGKAATNGQAATPARRGKATRQAARKRTT